MPEETVVVEEEVQQEEAPVEAPVEAGAGV